jgi:hypothetical protein
MNLAYRGKISDMAFENHALLYPPLDFCLPNVAERENLQL